MEEKVNEGTLGRYLEFKFFELFRDRFLPIIRNYSRIGSKETDVYDHLFLSPADLSKERAFQVQGALSPFVCMWRNTPLIWNEELGFYGRSVLPRDFHYKDSKGHERAEYGFLYDLKFDLTIHTSSYYKDFRDRVNQDLLDIDRLRYFKIDVKELLPDCDYCLTTCELMLGKNITFTDKPKTKQGEIRSFEMDAPFSVKVSIPYTKAGIFYERFNLYLNERLIYTKELTNEDKIPN